MFVGTGRVARGRLRQAADVVRVVDPDPAELVLRVGDEVLGAAGVGLVVLGLHAGPIGAAHLSDEVGHALAGAVGIAGERRAGRSFGDRLARARAARPGKRPSRPSPSRRCRPSARSGRGRRSRPCCPGTGSVVAGNSGRPQFENGAGSSPFSGQGGAGGWSAPSGANTCCAQIACCSLISFWSVGMRIGLAAAVPTLSVSPASAMTTNVPTLPRRLVMVIRLKTPREDETCENRGRRSVCCGGRSADDPVDDLVDRQAGRIERDRVWRRR